MDDQFVERREFYRVAYEKQLKFREFSKGSASMAIKAVSKNISQSGILFIAGELPKISSIIWINLPMKELAICKEIEARAVTVKNGILGKVVRVEENLGRKGYSVGVCFLKKDDSTIRSIEEKIEKALSSCK